MINLILYTIFGYSILLRFYYDLGIEVAPIHKRIINSGILTLIVGFYILARVFPIPLCLVIMFIFYFLTIYSFGDVEGVYEKTFGSTAGPIFEGIAGFSKPIITSVAEDLGLIDVLDETINLIEEDDVDVDVNKKK